MDRQNTGKLAGDLIRCLFQSFALLLQLILNLTGKSCRAVRNIILKQRERRGTA